MQIKRIIAMPCGGLGNRMRVIASCVQIARENNIKLFIVWNKNSSLGCDLEDIFKSVGVRYYKLPSWQHKLYCFIFRHGAINRHYRIYKLIGFFLFQNSWFDKDIMRLKGGNSFSNFRHGSALFVCTCYAFGRLEGLNSVSLSSAQYNSFKIFEVTDYLRERINQELKKIERQFLGVHIRRGDHAELIRRSPLENYFSAIEDSMRAENKPQLFLATDDHQIKDLLTERYGSSIVTLNNKLSRCDKEGIYASVIELYILSEASKIICSKLSSFSTAAIYLGNIQKTVFV